MVHEMDFERILVFGIFFTALAAAAKPNADTFSKLLASERISANDYLKANAEMGLLRRLEISEMLIQQLLGRMEYLETREKEQTLEIQDLRKGLALQKRYTETLEKLVQQTSRKNEEVSVNDETEDDNSYLITPVKDNKDMRSVRTGENRIRRADAENNVAFFAGITNHVTHIGINQTYVFDHAITNIGNAYNTHNGNFIAPVDGTYVFSVTLMSLYHVNSHARFFKNGQPITWMFVSGGEAGYDTTSQTIVLLLQKGDDVSVHNVDNDVSTAGNHYSTFSGFLLYESFQNPVVVGK